MGWSGEVEVVDDPAGEAAARLTAAAGAGGHVCLTGGSTPKTAYERAAETELDWSGATLWFGDDRCVPPEHEFSNYGMAKAALFDRIAGPQPGVKRIQGELGPGDGAAAYERALEAAFGQEQPRFDLLFLGLGPDCHTASLFPGAPQLGERERRAVGVEAPGMAPLVSRVTLTLPVLNAAREVVFLVSGADKADAVARAFSGRRDPDAPASLIAPEDGRLTLLVDPPAVERLRT